MPQIETPGRNSKLKEDEVKKAVTSTHNRKSGSLSCGVIVSTKIRSPGSRHFNAAVRHRASSKLQKLCKIRRDTGEDEESATSSEGQ